MANYFTHLTFGEQVLAALPEALSGPIRAHWEAFSLGCLGPDPLFFYHPAWPNRCRREGVRMHAQSALPAFQRLALAVREGIPMAKSYAAGFLCHYATDCVLHPYVVMITQPDQLYGQPGGHGYFEIALDSYLHKQDTGRASVPVKDNTPKLSPFALNGAVTLLQTALQSTLGVSVSRQALTDTFAHTRLLRGQFVSRLRIKYALFWLVEPIIGHRGFITGHITPARLKTKSGTIADLPAEWIHPFTKEPRRESVGDLLEEATRRSAAFLLAAQGYWEGKLTLPHVMELIGSNSYLSGLPDAQSAPQSST